MKKITLAGYGFVGKAVYATFKDAHNVTISDPQYNNTKIYDVESAGVIVCVPTPQDDDGKCDMSYVIDVINDTPNNVPVLIKSTISLEGWKEIKDMFPAKQITFSPEFLVEATAEEDFKNQKIMYVGGGDIDFWLETFRTALPQITFSRAEVESLILIKYFRNSFLATKVSFFNQVHDLCKATGQDYNIVAQGITEDPRIGKSHTQVPGPDGYYGYGGHCFPKDTNAIVKTASNFEIDLSVIKTAMSYNSKVRNEQ